MEVSQFEFSRRRSDATKLRAKAIRCAFAPLRDIYFQIETLPLLLSSCLSFKIPYICNPKMKIPGTNFKFQFWRQLTEFGILNVEFSLPDVVKLVDTSDLGSDAARYGGSSPSIRTMLERFGV